MTEAGHLIRLAHMTTHHVLISNRKGEAGVSLFWRNVFVFCVSSEYIGMLNGVVLVQCTTLVLFIAVMPCLFGASFYSRPNLNPAALGERISLSLSLYIYIYR